MRRVRLAPLIAAAASLALAGSVAADPPQHRDHGQSPPGQTKAGPEPAQAHGPLGKAQVPPGLATPGAAGVPPGHAPAADATAAPAAPAADPAPATHGHAGHGAAKAHARAASPPAVATVADGSRPSAGVSAAGPAASAVAAASPVSSAPAAPVPTTAPSPVPTFDRPATHTGRRQGTVARVRLARRRAARRRSRPRQAVAGRHRSVTPVVRTLSRPASPFAAAPRPARPVQPRRHPAATPRRHSAGRASPIVRTVEQILEVVPGWVAIATAAAAVLGLLLAAAALLQTLRVRRLERARRRLAADVGLLQAALLPDLPGEVGRARVTASYRPADGLAAGGDFFDVFVLPDGQTAVVLGDMAGHGREIVPLTAIVRYSLRAYLEAGLEPRMTLQVANTVLERQLRGHLATAVVAVFDPDAGRLTYACAGHAQPLIGPPALAPVTAASSPPIGAGATTGRRQTTVALPAGSAACFWTDGVADVRVGDARLGPEGVAEHFAALGPGSAAEDLLESVVRASDAQPDDMALCVLAPLAGGARPAPEMIEELEADADMLHDGRVGRFLQRCAVGPAQAAAARRSVAEMIARSGHAVLVVRRSAAGPEVLVQRPPATTLPVARSERRTFAVA